MPLVNQGLQSPWGDSQSAVEALSSTWARIVTDSGFKTVHGERMDLTFPAHPSSVQAPLLFL